MTANSWIFAILAAVSVLAGILLTLKIQRIWRARKLARRFEHARDGESRARSFLLKHGFTILDEQAELAQSVRVDGVQAGYVIRADFLVRKHGRRAVVDAKTGNGAVDPVSTATRRQLMEYSRCYDVDDVYLFDGERGMLKRVQFNAGPVAGRYRNKPVAWFFIGLIFGVLVTSFLMYVLL